MSADLSDYAKWYAAAKRSASAAHDVYERGTVEHELALQDVGLEHAERVTLETARWSR